ncbi:zf-HC2 domain-containing protein [Kitasatospora sp. NBC_00458]|uniref:zf-HC2 domain-containing protein n=1 Tax=Kitasatospora sp. NBC_00458 TaxID=2903568 RepID=UPI002E18B07A
MTAPLSSPDPAPASGPHPSVDELADLAEGLIEARDAAEALRHHLAGCPECRETADALAEVRTLLGATEPPAMPADVAARLDAALAAAAADHAATGTGSAPASGEPGSAPQTPGNAPQAPRDAPAPPRPPHAAPTPSAAPRTPPGAPAGRPAASTGPGRAHSRRRRAALLLGSAAALLAVGLGGTFLALSSGTDRSLRSDGTVAVGGPAAASALPARPGSPDAKTDEADQAAGGTAYRDDLLAAQVRQLLTRKGAGSASGPAVKPSGPGASGSTAAPPADAQGLTGGGHSAPACPPPATGPLLATDLGSYRGAPAEVLVFGIADRPDQVEVYLRSPDCGPVLQHLVVPSR